MLYSWYYYYFETNMIRNDFRRRLHSWHFSETTKDNVVGSNTEHRINTLSRNTPRSVCHMFRILIQMCYIMMSGSQRILFSQFGVLLTTSSCLEFNVCFEVMVSIQNVLHSDV